MRKHVKQLTGKYAGQPYNTYIHDTIYVCLTFNLVSRFRLPLFIWDIILHCRGLKINKPYNTIQNKIDFLISKCLIFFISENFAIGIRQ